LWGIIIWREGVGSLFTKEPVVGNGPRIEAIETIEAIKAIETMTAASYCD